VAALVRTAARPRRRIKARPRVVLMAGARMRAAVRLVWPAFMPWVGAMPPTGLELVHLEPHIELDCRYSRGRPWPLLVSLTRETLCHGPSLNPLVWGARAGLGANHDGRERHTPSHLRPHVDVAPSERGRPRKIPRRPMARLAVRLPPVLATSLASARPRPATLCCRPPARASPLPA
jgi:hypothetical protein